MDGKEVPRKRLELKDDRKLLSPPWLAEPLYQCANSGHGAAASSPHANVDVEVAGADRRQPAGRLVPEPNGATLVRCRPRSSPDRRSARASRPAGATERLVAAPSSCATTHRTIPAGPPRPQINPAPVYECGSRTGVGNLLAGGNVWITADGVEVGRVNGCAHPAGRQRQPRLRARPAGAGLVRAVQGPESAVDRAHHPVAARRRCRLPGSTRSTTGGDQLRITGIVNGARVTLVPQRRTAGHVAVLGRRARWSGSRPPFATGETFSATQRCAPATRRARPAAATVQPCSACRPRRSGPVQAGDNHVTVNQLSWRPAPSSRSTSTAPRSASAAHRSSC